jgi:magnesium transporter
MGPAAREMAMTDVDREPEEESTDVTADVEAVMGALRPPPGSAPGTIVADPDAPHPVIRLIAYSPTEIIERQLGDIGEAVEFIGQYPVAWVNIDGLGDIETLRRAGEIFGLHRLALEDVAHTHQRPKVEEYDEHTFLVLRMPQPGTERFETDQISIFLGANYVLTFQEREGDCWDPIRKRLRTARGRLRHTGADYLAYGLIDSLIDAYFPILEQTGEEVERLEDELAVRTDVRLVGRIHEVKRELLGLRRVIWPLREMINTLIRDRSPRITEATQIYFRDCYDHVIMLIDIVEIYRDIAAGLHDLYLSSMSNRLNEVIKVLTIISTIFIPLSFIASVYGMNFEFMPELHWKYGYAVALGLMGSVAAILLAYFWRKGWIGWPGSWRG